MQGGFVRGVLVSPARPRLQRGCRYLRVCNA
jgi:hypothetical protein